MRYNLENSLTLKFEFENLLIIGKELLMILMAARKMVTRHSIH